MTFRPGGTGGDAEFFDDAYHRILEPFHSEAEARRETAAVREILRLSQDDRILDLACGWGRHLQLLREAGHDAVGVDLSEVLLRRASGVTGHGSGVTGQRVAGQGVAGQGSRLGSRLVAGDMLRLPFREGSFDAVLNLATSLGLFLDDALVVAALREARRVLRPGGRLLIEGMHRDDVVAGYAERDAWELEDGTVVRARRRFDAVTGVSHEVLRWEAPAEGAGEAGSKRHSLRLRTATEVVRLLEAAGLGVEAVYGGWERARFGRESERLIVLAAGSP